MRVERGEMKWRLGAFVCLVAVVGGLLDPAAVAASGCAGFEDGYQDYSVPLPDDVSVQDPRVRVILPTTYCDPGNHTEYPVVYLLHGVGDTYQTWVANTDVEVFAPGQGVIIVMPDGGKTPEAGWYSDWVDESRQWETFHTKVLVDWVDETFRTSDDRAQRAVAGLSMGGFGAMSYAARHPQLFSVAASFSGFTNTMYGWPASGFAFEAGRQQFGTPDDRVWGDHIEDEAEWRAHNPTDLVDDLAGTKLFITTGTGTPGGEFGDAPANPGAYAIENFIWQINVTFRQALDEAGVAYTDGSYPGGYHGWPYWEAALHWALPQIAAEMAEDAD